MLIKALSVEGIGRFGTLAQIDGFSHGVNVLAAGNEVGKSTLFKALRTCLFARHDSKTQDIRELASDDSQLPATVQLTFESAGQTYVIKKSFLRSPSATLMENGQEIARSKQADEAVWDLLGLSPGSGRSLDDGAFGILWVGQGASFAAPVPGPGASSMLSTAIEAEVGALLGGERARQVLEDINSELRRYLTEGDRPKSDGPLQRAIRNLEQWQRAEEEAQSKLVTLEQQITEMLQRQRRHRELTDPLLADQMAQELVEANNALAEARSSSQEIRRLEAEESNARRGIDSAAQRLKQFRDLVSRINANRVSEAALLKELPQQQAREQEARAGLVRTQEQLASVEKNQSALSIREQQLEKLEAAVIRALRKDDLSAQLKSLEKAASDLVGIDAQLSQFRVKPKIVDELDDLDRQIASLDAQLSAGAAHLTVEIKPEGAGLVRVGNIRPKNSHSEPVLSPTKITVGELAVVSVTPAANPRHEKRQTVDAERSSLLKSIGVETVTDAHALLSKRRDLEITRKGIVAELKSLKVTDDPTSIIGKLKSSIAETDAAISAALTAVQRKKLPTNKELEEERVELDRERTKLDARRVNLDETRDQQQQSVEDSVEARSGIQSKIELIRTNIAEDIALCPDSERDMREAALVATVATAESAFQTSATTLTVMRQGTPDAAEIEGRQARCERLEQAGENQKNELMQLEREIGRLTGQIQTAGGDGVGESLAAAQEQRALAERECNRVQERAATLQLLHDTISGCLAEGRERYFEPVRRHLRPFLHDLFPGAELELGEGYAITGIKRLKSENFKRLSDGTQEQIAVLVRLAMGSMLAERGVIVPIILDDALVYCDDDRIKRMFDALSRAGKYQQIIVFTCRLRTFSSLGGNILQVRVPAKAEGSFHGSDHPPF